MSTRRPLRALATVFACALAVGACGSDDETAGTTTPAEDTASPTTTADSATGSTGTDPSGIPPASAPDDGGSGTATLTYQGETYEFSSGGCSSTLDPNQFVFRDPATPNVDPTYFAITVTLDAPATTGGAYPGAITYQRDGAFVLSVSDATLEVADDLRSGTFTGKDFASGDTAEGSWTC